MAHNTYKKHISYRWKDSHGNNLTAGGILPFDNNGVWVIREKRCKEIVLSDIGGRYRAEDGDIYVTIAREFGEETYYSSFLTRDNIISIAQMYKPRYVTGYRKKPVYICYPVNVEVLSEMNIELSSKKFDEMRCKVISQNPDVPKDIYSSLKLEYIPHSIMKKCMNKSETSEYPPLSFRLSKVLTDFYRETKF